MYPEYMSASPVVGASENADARRGRPHFVDAARRAAVAALCLFGDTES